VFGLQLGDEITSLQVLAEFLKRLRNKNTHNKNKRRRVRLGKSRIKGIEQAFPHSEVEELRLLLIGPFLGQTRLVQVPVGNAGLHGLGGRAVGEAVGHVEVLQHRHVLQGGQRRSPGLLHLE